MNHHRFCLASACVLTLVSVAPAFAQSTPSAAAAEQARMHFGPLALDPKISLRDFGVDSNVNNDASSPQQDFTLKVVPAADAWLRMGRATLTSTTTVGWTYFHESSQQRSFDLGEEVRVEVGLVRFMPWVNAGYVDTRQRPNLEVDARVHQEIRSAGAGAVFNAGGRLQLHVDGLQRTLAFGSGRYGDSMLAAVLDRRERRVDASVRYALTPLTTLVVRTGTASMAFDQATVRNSHSISVVPGFEFRPAALISGKGFVGVKRFTGESASLPDFTGVVAEVDAAYLFREFTRFNVRASRDLEYSIDETQPYFVSTGGELSVTQALGTQWDVVGRIGRTQLDYRALESMVSDPAVRSRQDRVMLYGVGIGRRLRSEIRIGVDVNHLRRNSVISTRGYSGTRIGGSITYGV